MKVLLIDNHTKHRKDLIDFLVGLFAEVECLARENLANDFDFSAYDFVVLSGGSDVPTVLRHRDIYQKEIEIVQNLQKPILGICLGAEIVVSAFSGELYEITEKIEGERKINVFDENLADYIGSHKVSVFEGHHIGIKKVGDEFDILAESSNGPEIIKHKTKPIIALQFHPEKTSNQKFNDWISLIFSI